MWAFVTADFRIYVHKEGYLRTSSGTFSLDNVDDKCVHLTNQSLQVNEEAYAKFEAGNTLTYANL